MNRQSVNALPEGWRQFARRSLWPGIDVTHFDAAPFETEFRLDSTACISLIKVAPRYETREGGCWHDLSVDQGAICFLPDGYETVVRSHGRVEAINVLVDMQWLMGCHQTIGIGLPLLAETRYSIRDAFAAKLILEVYKDNQRGASNGLPYAESMVLALLCRLNALTHRSEVLNESNDDVAVRNAIDYIHSHLDSPLTLYDVVRASGFEKSLFAFSRVFRRYAGKTPHRYILEARLDYAKELLLHGARSVTDVAMACGFSNLSHFSDSFKNHWGTTPSALMLIQQPKRLARRES